MEIEMASENIGSSTERNKKEIKMLKLISLVKKLFATIKDSMTPKIFGLDGQMKIKLKQLKLVSFRVTIKTKVSNKEDTDIVPTEFPSCKLTAILINIQISRKPSDGISTLGSRLKHITIQKVRKKEETQLANLIKARLQNVQMKAVNVPVELEMQSSLV